MAMSPSAPIGSPQIHRVRVCRVYQNAEGSRGLHAARSRRLDAGAIIDQKQEASPIACAKPIAARSPAPSCGGKFPVAGGFGCLSSHAGAAASHSRTGNGVERRLSSAPTISGMSTRPKRRGRTSTTSIRPDKAAAPCPRRSLARGLSNQGARASRRHD